MDPKEKSISLDEFIFRKLQPIRVLRGFLRNELDLAEGETIAMSRQEFDDILSTVEIFLEEYDRVSGFRGRKGGSGSNHQTKQFMDAGKQSAIKQIA